MKKIINNRVYDTDTAQELGSWSNDGSWRDFSHTEETLYRKRTGEFFLHGEGGPATKYAEFVDYNTRTGGERIMPMTLDEAKQWAEAEMDGEDYEHEFGAVDESDERVTMSISLDAATADRIRKAAQEAGMSISAMIASKF